MGKCKRRTLHKTNSSYFMTREGAINNVFRIVHETRKKHRSKKHSNYKEMIDTISLFGISIEELSEAGLPYENLRALDSALI